MRDAVAHVTDDELSLRIRDRSPKPVCDKFRWTFDRAGDRYADEPRRDQTGPGIGCASLTRGGCHEPDGPWVDA